MSGSFREDSHRTTINDKNTNLFSKPPVMEEAGNCADSEVSPCRVVSQCVSRRRAKGNSMPLDGEILFQVERVNTPLL